MLSRSGKIWSLGAYLWGLSVCLSTTYGNLVLQPKIEVERAVNEQEVAGAELKIHLTNWDQNTIRYLLKKLTAADVCATFSISTKSELQTMQTYVDSIADLFFDMQNKLGNMPQDMRASMKIISKEVELLQAYYKDCFDELPHQKSVNTSAFAICINHLQKFKDAARKLRNSTNDIADEVRAMIAEHRTSSKADYQNLKGVGEQVAKLTEYCKILVQLIDGVLNSLDELLKVYHEGLFGEKNNSLQRQTRRTIRG